MLRNVSLTETELNIIATHIEKDIEYWKEEVLAAQEKLDKNYSRYADIMGYPHKDMVKSDESILQLATPMPLWVKVKNALLSLHKFSTTRVIAEKINEASGGIMAAKDISKMIGDISATLAPKVKNKKDFIKFEDYGEVFFGLLEWVDENGHIIKQYNYKSSPEDDFSEL